MSEWGAIVDRIEADVRAAQTDLGAGSLGWTRGAIVGQDLGQSRLPHIASHSFVEIGDELDYAQVQTGLRLRLDLFTRNETQEEVSVRLDAIKAAIHADRQLGGLVERVWVAGRGLLEFPGKTERNVFLVLEMEWID